MSIGISNAAPRGDDWIVKELADLKRQIRELAAARTLESASIDQGGLTLQGGGNLEVADGGNVHIDNGGAIELAGGGSVNVFDGGNVQVIGGVVEVFDSNGTNIAQLGRFTDGAEGVALSRPDGTYALYVADGFASIMDRTGNIVISDDASSGQGIATPYIPLGTWNSVLAPPRAENFTTSSAFVTVETCSGYKQHPRLMIQVLVQCSNATTAGEVRIIDVNGVILGGTQTVPAGEYAYHQWIQAPLPGQHTAQQVLNLQVRRTVGAGSIGARGIYAVGVQSP